MRSSVVKPLLYDFQELRVLKNFSSLKAIISGLQSNPVYRLKKAWGHLPRDKMETFQVSGLPGNLFCKCCH